MEKTMVDPMGLLDSESWKDLAQAVKHSVEAGMGWLTEESKPSRMCPQCGQDTSIIATHYNGLGAFQIITCPHCQAELVSDYIDGGFGWKLLK